MDAIEVSFDFELIFLFRKLLNPTKLHMNRICMTTPKFLDGYFKTVSYPGSMKNAIGHYGNLFLKIFPNERTKIKVVNKDSNLGFPDPLAH